MDVKDLTQLCWTHIHYKAKWSELRSELMTINSWDYNQSRPNKLIVLPLYQRQSIKLTFFDSKWDFVI